jgi:hypothetical protein
LLAHLQAAQANAKPKLAKELQLSILGKPSAKYILTGIPMTPTFEAKKLCPEITGIREKCFS